MTTEFYGVEFTTSPAQYLQDTAWNLAMVAVGLTSGIVLYMRRLLAEQCTVGIFGGLSESCQFILDTGQHWAGMTAFAGAAMFVIWGLSSRHTGDN